MAATETLIFTESPLSAKKRFQFRPLCNWAACAAIFTVAAIFLRLWTSGVLVWLLDIVVIGLLTYVNFYILGRRAIVIRCPLCFEIVRTNTPWVCGFCDKPNTNADDFPFVNECEHCGAEQKSYKCHHCNKRIFLTEDRLEQNFAYCLNTSEPEVPVEDETVVRKKELEDLKHEIDKTELLTKLQAGKEKLEFTKKKSPQEEIEESFKKFDARVMGSEEYARKQREIYKTRYKDDPEMLKRSVEALDAWLRGRT